MGWKSKKDGTHFNTDKTIRSSEPGTEVNIEIDNNSEEFSEGVRKDWIDDKVKCVDCGVNFTQHSLGKQNPDFIRCASCEEKNSEKFYANKFDKLSHKKKVDIMASLWSIRPEHVDTTGYEYSYFEPDEKEQVNSMLNEI